MLSGVGLLALAVVLEGFVRPTPASAAAPAAGGRPEVRLGFDGIAKIGVSLPLEVVLPSLPRSGHAELVVDAPALGPDVGRVLISTVVPFAAVAGAAQVIRAPVTVSDSRRPLRIRVAIDGAQVFQTAVAVTPDQVADRVVVALSDDHAGLAALHRLPGRVAVGYVTAEMLPRRWQEYAAVDLLVIRDLDPAALDDAQREALLTWVRLGGHLLLVARPATPLPAFLDPVLPARAGEVRVVPPLAELAARYGGTFPPSPVAITTLVPRPGAGQVFVGDLPVIVSAGAGAGRVTVWGFDPWGPPVRAWDGRLPLWDETIGRESAPSIDPTVLADRLVFGTPLDPAAHAQVGGAIVLYIALLLGVLRWKPTMAGAAAALLIVFVGLGAFSALAERTRSRSASLTQATVLGPEASSGQVRATTVAAVAVPYGGRYQITVSPGMVAGAVTPSSNLRLELARAGTVLTGTLRSGEPPRPFQAVGAVSLAASASLADEGRSLSVDLGRGPVHHVELRWRDRAYRLGDLPAGRTVRALHPDGWSAVTADGRALSEFSARVRDGIFQGPMADAILKAETPVLVGELEWPAPVFTLGGAGAPGQRLTILLLPLERR